jgi:hypothetical protein
MTNDLAVSMAELEGESAELLPSRETLYCWKGGGHSNNGHNISDSFNQTNGNAVGLLAISAFSGNNNSFDGNFLGL